MTVEELVAGSRSGDIAAFEQLVSRFQAMAYGYAWAMTGDAHLAEDATQQAFLVAFVNLPNLRDPARFGGWLRGIVRFESLRLLRSSRPTADTSNDLRNAIDTAPGPAEQAEANESLDRVTTAIAVLPDNERTVAALYYLHDQSQRDVARFMNLSVSQVNNRLRSARKHMRQGELFPMTTSQQAPDFSSRIGTILRAKGPLIDARFERDRRPTLLSTITIETDGATPLSTAFVSQYVDDDIVRLVVSNPSPSSKTLRAGVKVTDQGEPVNLPLDGDTIRSIVDTRRQSGGTREIVETGIKVIDAFAPIVQGGTVALVGDMNVGKVVVVEEILHRLASTSVDVSMIVFLQVPDEVGTIHRLAQQQSGKLDIMFLPVRDASPEALANLLQNFVSVIAMSRELGEKQLYPAIDPRASRSSSVPESDEKLIDQANRALDKPGIAELLRNYLTQPFFVAEPFTNRPGVVVPRQTTLTDLERIISGNLGQTEGAELYMIGALPSSK
jgi:RNA polymerase sigma factor (sigma-70 family)